MWKLLAVAIVVWFSSNVSLANTSNKIRVLGVIAGDPGIALLKDGSGKTFATRTGTAVKGQDDMRLVFVDRGQVTFKTPKGLVKVKVGDHVSEYSSYAAASAQGSGYEVQGDTVKIEKSYKEHILNNELNKVLMQAAAVPFYEAGTLRGFQLLEIDPESIYDKFGFQNGDVVTKINGHQLNDVRATIRLLTSLKQVDNVDLTLMRSGAERNVRLVVQ